MEWIEALKGHYFARLDVNVVDELQNGMQWNRTPEVVEMDVCLSLPLSLSLSPSLSIYVGLELSVALLSKD